MFEDPDQAAWQLALARERAGMSSMEVRASLEGHLVHRTSNAVRHVLTLQADANTQFDRLNHETRRKVRQAQRSNLVVREGQDADALTKTFYELHLDTRRRLGSPVQPKRFFRVLWEEVIAQGLGFVLLAYAGSKPVAGRVCLTWNANVIGKFNASDRDAWHLRPNDLLLWHAIQHAIELGGRSFDFGRSDLDHTGLRRFKTGWGAREEPLVYSYLSPTPPGKATRDLSSRFAPFIRHSPRWVPRLLGELLYRYAA
jgi:lipid II:glycine glycyltransferase (peptidoglycan interpeptide bridge formation enzyme)